MGFVFWNSHGLFPGLYILLAAANESVQLQELPTGFKPAVLCQVFPAKTSPLPIMELKSLK